MPDPTDPAGASTAARVQEMAASSSGRTPALQAENAGSIPAAATTLAHARDEKGRCQPWCYACERKGLQERIKFTENYESLRARLTEAEQARDEIVREVSRYAPNGSPPPGGSLQFVRWVLASLDAQEDR